MKWGVCFLTTLFSTCFLTATQNPSDLESLVQEAVIKGYHEDFIDLVEMIYGKGFISQGGKEFAQRVVGDLDIENRSVLDIGSGLGGPILHLAELYQTKITGLEPQKWLFDRAQKHLEEARPKLRGSVEFVLMEHPAHLKQFPDENFDVVMSKETILHIPLQVKKGFFAEIYRVLKTGGEIVIMDWMHAAPSYSKKTERMMELDGVSYHFMTPVEYITLLKEVGFSEVTMENISSETAGFSQGNIDKIREIAPAIEESYGRDVYDYCVESWGYQRDAFASKELISGIFRAKKL